MAVVATVVSTARRVAAETTPADVVQQTVARMRQGSPAVVDGEPLSSTVLLPAFYERRRFQPAWTPAALESLLDAIRDSALEGLDPGDYHRDALLHGRDALDGTAPPVARAAVDLIATDALIRLGYHARFGKVDQRDIFSNWNFDGPLTDGDPVVLMNEAIGGANVAAVLHRLVPQHPFYRALKVALARYRAIAAAGGWTSLPETPKIKLGGSDPRIPDLRRRLAIEGDLGDGGDATSPVLDATLAEAVARFQTRHGLAADGTVGMDTIRALNVPVASRIDQLRISLDRARAVMHDLPRRFVVVNVAGFIVYVIDGDGPMWESRVVVGKPYTQTPIFRADMTHVVLNPTWTVPPGIMRNEIGPGLRRDPSYLAKKGLVRQDDGRVVQPPGPKNALGRIKLMFPNPHDVYLHDTPSRELFAQTTRAFSHGCIRVNKPVDLATLALDDPSWTTERLEDAIATGKTQTINLGRRLPVLVLYWTATVGESGLVYFLDDPYKRDGAALAALDAPFRAGDPRALVPRGGTAR